MEVVVAAPPLTRRLPCEEELDLEDGIERVRSWMPATGGDSGEIIGLREVIESDFLFVCQKLRFHP